MHTENRFKKCENEDDMVFRTLRQIQMLTDVCVLQQQRQECCKQKCKFSQAVTELQNVSFFKHAKMFTRYFTSDKRLWQGP